MRSDLAALSRTRALLAGWLQQWQLRRDATDDAVLVANELISNAAEHGRSDALLEIVLDGSGLLLSVRDYSSALPHVQPFDPTAKRGRGLQIIDRLSGSWGVTELVDGKAVWVRFPFSPAS